MHVQLAQLQNSLSSAIEGMSPAELRWHPAGKWCVLEILEHLHLTYTGTAKGMERVLSAGQPLCNEASLKNRLQAFVVIGLGYLPEGRKAPKTAEPRGLPREQILAGIMPALARMDEAIGLCEKRFGAKRRVLDHPILGALSAPGWRKFHLVHGLHHVKQIVRLRADASRIS